MYKILKNTPFGFIFELENDYCYFNNSFYEIYINNMFYLSTNKNVVSIFGLKINTIYNVSLKGLKKDINFSIKTKDLNYLIDIRDYNAIGDGVSSDTSAINVAIYSAPKNSTIFIPKGIYLVEQILLKSDVDIYLEKGAIIKQNTNRNSLAVLKGYQKSYDHSNAKVNASWEGNPLDCYCSVIYGINIENVHIYGEGTIDGNGDVGDWWINHKVKNIAYRPKNIFLVRCENITISGICSLNSASWNIHPFYCKNVNINNLYIKSIETSPNTDGINPESCKDVSIVGCHFSVGDDCIAIKAGKYFMSKYCYQPTKTVIIRNCYMEKGHGGVVIGSEMSCGVEDVLVTNCYFEGTDRGLRIKTRRGRGSKAIVNNLKFYNIKMERVLHCFVVNMFYNCDPDGKSDYVRNKNVSVKDNETPSVRGIEISNISANNIIGSGVFIYGLPESKVENILLKSNTFHFSNERVNEVPAMMDDFEPIENLGIYICNGEEITFQDNKFIGEYVNIINDEKRC